LSGFDLTVGGTGLSFTNTATVLGVGGRIIKNGGGLLWLNNAANTFSGGFVLNAGEVAFTASGTVGSDLVITNTVFGTGKITLNGGTIRSSSDTSGRNIHNEVELNGDIQFGAVGAAATITLSTNAGSMTTFTKDSSITTVAPVVWEQRISAVNQALTKLGTNELQLRGPTTLSTLRVNQGDLIIRSTNNFSAVSVGGGARLGYGSTNASASNHFGDCVLVLSNGAALGQYGTNGTGTDLERTMTNSIRLMGNVAFGLGNFSSYLGGNIDLGGDIRTVSITNSTYLLGAVTNGGLSISNTSASRILYLNGANTYSSGTTHGGGILSVGNDSALGAGGLTVSSNAVTTTLTATDGRNITNSATLALGSSLVMDSGSTNSPTSTWTYSGPISGSGAITKQGVGTLTLAGALSYTGSTTVSAGALVVVTNNISATLSSNTIAITFSNSPANGTYAVLPGALTGTYSATYSNLGSSQKATFSTVSPASVTVASKASQTITGLASTDTKTFGASSYTLSVTKGASSSSLTFSSDNNSVATVSSAGLVTIVGVGSTTIRVNQAGDADYLAASEVTQTLTVAKANPTITAAPTASDITSGQALSSSILSGGSGSVPGSFGWTSPSTVPTGTGSFSVTFTPSDAANYNTATRDVSVTVTSSGPNFADSYKNKNMADIAPNGLSYLMNYAFGGSDNTEPKLPVQDTSDPAKLTLVAYVRTGDSTLSVVGEVASELPNFDSANTIAGDVMSSSDVPAGMEKRRYSVSVSGDKKFLRLKAIKQ
jgi:autotransporter-associated beta strand protein